MNTNKTFALAAALASLAGAAPAQDLNPSWYIQPSVLGIKPDRNFGTDKRDWGGGLRFGKPIDPLWDIQMGATYARAKDNGANYDQTTLGIDALLMMSRKTVRPFLLLGVGAERDKVDNALRHVSKSSPYLAGGIGLQVVMSPQWSFQADLRTVRGRLRDEAAYGFNRSNNKYLSLAFNYSFDRPAPPPPPPRPAPPEVQAPPPPPPPPPPAPPPAPPAPRFERVTLSATEMFDFDSATLKGAQPKLDDIASALMADTTISNITITGYTDRIGSKRYNQRLSERRANAVRDYLVNKGVAGNRLTAIGKGSDNPVVTCNEKKRADLIKCLEPNRRVEVEQITVERRLP
ncbi:OmpA family protein [Massilia sp. TS11]|uniref:OmpA family protein n=1 Tax=Massilia sp. TS11 TaxID=2908003 RepID=UPI001EDB2B79|nr:OmpA family protein [Massilia sp. TS11]MCG2584442.1 OmpA family protein [Massilia sp. TS11]